MTPPPAMTPKRLDDSGGMEQTGVALCVIGMLVLSTDTVLMRLTQLDPWPLTFWRGLLIFATAIPAMWVLHRYGGIRLRFRRGWKDDAIGVLYGCSSLFFVLAIHMGPVADALFIIATAPLFAAVLSMVFLREPVAPATWLAIAGALLGIGLVSASGLGQGTWTSALSALLCALSLAGAFTLSRTQTHVSSLGPAYGGGLACIVAAGLHLVLTPEAAFVPESGLLWLWLLINGAVVLPVALGLLATAPRFLPSPQVSLFLLLETALGPIWVWLVLEETPSPLSLTGGAIVILVLASHGAWTLRQSHIRSRDRERQPDHGHP